MAVTTSTSTPPVNPYDALNQSMAASAAATKKNAASTAASRAAASAKTSLTQSEFLKLMTTQMTHQDPNNPMQNGEFLSQMAQFGTVSGIQDLQNSFASFSQSIQSDQALQAASIVGRDVTVSSGQGVLTAGGNISGDVNLASSTTDLQVTVINSTTGELVKTLDLGTQSSGNIPFSWDGTNTAGTLANPGTYKITASAMVNGQNTSQSTDINSKVQSVTMATGSNGMQVNLADGSSVDFTQVKQIL